MSTLAINAGSSSVKFGLFKDENWERLVTGEIDWADGDRQQAQLVVRPRNGATVRSRCSVPDSAIASDRIFEALFGAESSAVGEIESITAVGHRVVHGGTEFRASALVDDHVKGAIRRLNDLAPLHNPAALKGMEAAEAALPGIPGVAVFDTAFYAHLAPKSFLYAVPYEWYQNWGIRRFGFHGISHAYCANRAAELVGKDPTQLRIVTCHLGGGCSLTAVRGGMAVATTSGFSPLDGLMMGTRCGAIDPGILLQLQRDQVFSAKELERALNRYSGLLGVSGVSADLARIEKAAAQGNQRARLAFDMFADQVRCAVGALAVSMDGLDVLTFTDRIGERSERLRAAVCEGLHCLGVQLDFQRNAAAGRDSDIAAADSDVRVLVLHTEEELLIAQEAHRVIGRRSWCGGANT